MSIQKQHFGFLPNGTAVSRYILQNKNGMTVALLDYAGAIQQLLVPDRKGRLVDVVGGYDNILDYVYGDGYQGSLVGRIGNRIKEGKFTLDGKTYTLAVNNGPNHLHGGIEGFSSKIWTATPHDGEEPSLSLSLVSPDGDEGYPGTLSVTVTYTLMAENALAIRYVATTDRTTIVNLTNHSYFNLGGFASGKILEHELWLDADTYLPTDDTLIPTGELRAVKGTPFDFTAPKTVGRDFFADDVDLKNAGGYDHCFNFVGGEQPTPVPRAVLYCAQSGIEMTTKTTLPAVQFYSGNFLNNPDHPFKGGYPQALQNALCLETQKMPDSINHDNFTDVRLFPGEAYDHTTVYAFGVRGK
ncbi:MAG: galactose mutarotase [Ruminococcaceae bacterium]|nr:galactose mutarotase [Oscillospiraceae bacterium]